MFFFFYISKDEQFSSNLFKKKFFCFTNYIIISLQVISPRTTSLTRIYSNCLLSGACCYIVLQLEVSQSNEQDLVAFQVHPADLPRRFQQSLKLDNYYQA